MTDITVKTFDAWRLMYDYMDHASQCAFYEAIARRYPHQKSFNDKAWINFFEWLTAREDSLAVTEVGGWDGFMADKLLKRHDRILQWDNHEIAPQVVSSPYCKVPRYRAILTPGFVWEQPLTPGNVFVASHLIEHLKERDLRALIGRLGSSVRYAGIEAPIKSDVTGYNWSGYLGTHILEIGWQQVIQLMDSYGFAVVNDLSHETFRGFIRK